MSSIVGEGNCELADVKTIDLSSFDGIWCSPPCQLISRARTQGKPISQYTDNLIEWCLSITKLPLWVENVNSNQKWGTLYNAAQFTPIPLQNRNRIIGGRYKQPKIHHSYKKIFPEAVATIMATEYKAAHNDQRRASRSFGRRLSLEEVAFYQGFNIPHQWLKPMFGHSDASWRNILFETIGNGVPCYMSKAFGEAYDSTLES